VITLHTALTAARQTLVTVTERAERQGYYSGARTDIINSHAELRAALDLLIKAAEHEHAAAVTRGPDQGDEVTSRKAPGPGIPCQGAS
jgi:hypothetical protein